MSCTAETACWAELTLSFGLESQTKGLLRSNDGGLSWQFVSLPSGVSATGWLSCTDGEHCLLIGDGSWFRTTDGGKTWNSSISPVSGLVFYPTCENTEFCVTTGDQPSLAPPDHEHQPVLLVSRDGERTWTVRPLPAPSFAGPEAVGRS
jgi:hypothetical protein